MGDTRLSQSSGPKKNLLHLTLAGLPELDLFEAEQDREAALAEIGQEAANLRSAGFWVNVALTAMSGPIGFVLARLCLAFVLWPRWLEGTIPVLAGAASFGFTLRWLHRRGAAQELRVKLMASGVPVCLACGYLLRGLPLSPGRCPECGRPFDETVRGILAKSV